MKKTKEIILENSLELFNSLGLSNVTLRTIANKMEISQGNLNYHFKKREDIIEALYFKLVKSIDNSMSSMQEFKNPFKSLVSISQTMMNNFYEYRFFLLDFVQIMRENKKIKIHYSKLITEREQQFSMLFNLLIENDLIREEILPNEYKNLYKRLQLLSDFWIADAEIFHSKLTKKSISTYSVVLMQSIFPYLTLKGQNEYKLIVSDEL
ncbi:TetR/AcrR family transcriptional regulator [Tamlana sp. 2_MG-2023]|uniref:TetR/AcrR family transcriptional regulator n=1 Tax=unclassified Tamlana TaxID=2614803 RepID=UPI0026E1A47B|nr:MULTISPECIES: TetR/AcrR family transcriptional regulator [unclassified Tamlana]MDO6759352.1 TetR/AcrR family transcriptional regulator [Tamlana sp. 2_MG-2023]MDO6790509.1 TetR/AcrR family transcriptional regulator [Tamlana sp. 1_MG-2023]